MSRRLDRRDEVPAGLAARIERAAAPALDALALRARRRVLGGLTALLVVPTLIVAVRLATPGPAAPATRLDARWLAQRVGPDGRIAPGDWTGPRAAESGLHALALLALARSDDGDAAAITRAADWLVERQRPDGALADATQDQAVATLALIESWRRTGATRLRDGAQGAVTALVERLAEAPRTDEAEAAWSLQALLTAQDAGLDGEHRAALDRARTRLAAELGGSLDRDALAKVTLSPQAAPRRSGLGEVYVATVALLAGPGPVAMH